jgi:lipoyl(octanoyl) transferase
MEYGRALRAMQSFTEKRTPETPDEIWLLEHHPVFTLGAAEDASHLLATHSIPVVRSDRGGNVTYHAPGQVVAYLLFDIHRAGISLLRDLVYRVEEVLIHLLLAYDLHGVRRPGAPGIYMDARANYGVWQGAKIAAIGMKVNRKGYLYHGFSLNVSMDLQAFSWIHPCGHAELQSVDMRTLGVTLPVDTVMRALVPLLCQQFGVSACFPDNALEQIQ